MTRVAQRETRAVGDGLPLFLWPKSRQAEAMEMERRALTERAARLPLHSHSRVALQTRLMLLTARQLRIEQEIRSIPSTST